MQHQILATSLAASTGWFTTNKDLISGVASIAGVLGLFATAIALFFTGTQARRQRSLDQARAIYEIQRDARSEARSLFANDEVATALIGRTIEPIGVAVGTALNYYASVYQMWRLRVLDDRLFEPFDAELRGLVATPTGWERFDATKALFDSGFVEHVLALRASNAACKVPPQDTKTEEQREP